jgi:mRNA interferase RelE/StbE
MAGAGAGVRGQGAPVRRRATAERLPEAVAAAMLELCEAALAVNPYRVGKPLFGPLEGCRGARRGTYRIVYGSRKTPAPSTSLTFDHRTEIHRPHS